MLTMWIIVAIGAFLIEIFTLGNLICIWFIFGALAGALLAWLKFQAVWQYIAFFAVSIVSMLIIRPLAHNYLRGNIVPTNYDRLIGKKVTLSKEITAENWGEVNTDGTIWSCISVDNQPISEGTNVKIVAIEGAKLVVKRMD
ncbi:MAG: NfeD family protein [Erysipelotrichaceae bacterium]|jgi:membrane protein implicated in regulation of membrane protease activity